MQLATTIERHLHISTPASGHIFVEKDTLYPIIDAIAKDAVANARNDRIGGKPEGIFDGGFGAIAAGGQIEYLHLIPLIPGDRGIGAGFTAATFSRGFLGGHALRLVAATSSLDGLPIKRHHHRSSG
jgi:hypothetical protein